MRNPKVSIVIPTYNEERDIRDCLLSLMKQSYKNIEIIVVDDGSADNTLKIAKEFKKIKVIRDEHRGPGYSRNIGARASSGEILGFVDADMVFPEDYIKNLIKPIIEENAIGSEEFIQKASNLNNVWSKCWGAYSKENDPNRGYIFRAIRKKEFEKMGGFDPKYGYADDMTFYFKYGTQSVIARKAYCYHKNPESLKGVYKQSRWIGASLANTWKFLSIPLLRQFSAILLIPFSIIVIPLISVYKAIFKRMPLYIFHFLIFYTARYFGTLNGIYRRMFLGVNVR